MTEPRTLVDGIEFPESPRWHNDQLWFVDMFAQRVMTADLQGNTGVVAEYDDRLSGLGFLPDGTAIVGLMAQKKIFNIHTGKVHADLSGLGGHILNDMVVDNQGRAYVDHYASSRDPAVDSGDAIILVEPDGAFRIAAQGGLYRPNGLVITPEGTTLIAAMDPVHRLMAYTIGNDGSLKEGRVFADLGREGLDGICLDEAGAVWVATYRTCHFLRVLPGGEITDLIEAPDGRRASACMLGGPERKTLFMTSAHVPLNSQGVLAENVHDARGFIETLDVRVAGCGLP